MELTQAELTDAKTPSKSYQRKSSIELTTPKIPEKLCRICLEQLQDTEIPDLCLCKGENSYIHQKCLLEWVKRADKYEEFPYKYFYFCDLCKSRIYLDTEIKWLCKAWDKITFCGRSTCCTIVSLFVLAVGLILIIQGTILVQNSDLKELIWFGLVAGCIVIIVGMFFFVFQVFMEMEIVIHGLEKKKEVMKKVKKNQVQPNPEIELTIFETTKHVNQTSQASTNHLRDYQQ